LSRRAPCLCPLPSISLRTLRRLTFSPSLSPPPWSPPPRCGPSSTPSAPTPPSPSARSSRSTSTFENSSVVPLYHCTGLNRCYSVLYPRRRRLEVDSRTVHQVFTMTATLKFGIHIINRLNSMSLVNVLVSYKW
uniref:Uncharacterized protein n=1 Tax=Zea mays TaxID=4577 RepID=A0A804QNU7_MAIZE